MNSDWLDNVKKIGMDSQESRLKYYEARKFEARQILSLGYLREAQRINRQEELLLGQAGINRNDTSEGAQEYRKAVSEAFGPRICPNCHESKPDGTFGNTGGCKKTCVCWDCTSRAQMVCLTCGLPCTVLDIASQEHLDDIPLEPSSDGTGRIPGTETDPELVDKCMRCRKNAIDERSRGLIKRIICGFPEWIAGLLVD